MPTAPPVSPRCVVLGGSGFLGSHVVTGLRARGWEVASVGGVSEGPAGTSPDLTIDLSADLHPLRGVLSWASVVIVLAGRSAPPMSRADAEHLWAVNVEGTRKLAALVGECGTPRVVFASSWLVYGRTASLPVAESAPTRPIGAYAKTKLAAEKILGTQALRHSYSSVILRLANPYGPSPRTHDGYNFANMIVSAVCSDRDVRLYGGGGQLRDYVYVSDIVEAFAIACSMEVPYGATVLNIGTGTGTAMREFASTAIAIAGHGRILDVTWPSDTARREPGSYIADIRRARIHGFVPTVSLREGIEATIGATRSTATSTRARCVTYPEIRSTAGEGQAS